MSQRPCNDNKKIGVNWLVSMRSIVDLCEVILKFADECVVSSVVKIVIWISQKASLLINGQYRVSA